MILVVFLIFSKNGDYKSSSENRNIQPLFSMGYICEDLKESGIKQLYF